MLSNSRRHFFSCAHVTSMDNIPFYVAAATVRIMRLDLERSQG